MRASIGKSLSFYGYRKGEWSKKSWEKLNGRVLKFFDVDKERNSGGYTIYFGTAIYTDLLSGQFPDIPLLVFDAGISESGNIDIYTKILRHKIWHEAEVNVLLASLEANYVPWLEKTGDFVFLENFFLSAINENDFLNNRYGWLLPWLFQWHGKGRHIEQYWEHLSLVYRSMGNQQRELDALERYRAYKDWVMRNSQKIVADICAAIIERVDRRIVTLTRNDAP